MQPQNTGRCTAVTDRDGYHLQDPTHATPWSLRCVLVRGHYDPHVYGEACPNDPEFGGLDDCDICQRWTDANAAPLTMPRVIGQDFDPARERFVAQCEAFAPGDQRCVKAKHGPEVEHRFGWMYATAGTPTPEVKAERERRAGIR